MVYGMHPFPAGGALKPPGYSEQYSGAELIRPPISASGIPHSFLTNVQNFQSEASLWVTSVLAVRLFSTASQTQRGGVRGILDLAQLLARRSDKSYRLYRNGADAAAAETTAERKRSSTLHHGFEGDEAPPPRFPVNFYGDIPRVVVGCLSSRRDDAVAPPSR